jgi:hypothetical protein
VRNEEEYNEGYIELHVPTNSIQKLKADEKRWTIHLYSNTPPHVWRLPQASDVE